MTAQKDEDLMLRVAGGNREAMSPLLRRYASPLLTFIRRMTGDWHRAEELFQEAFLAVWQNRGRYEYPRPFRSWLFGIAANKCRADFRKAPGVPEPLSDWLDPPAAHEPSPVEAAISSETVTLVTQAVASLPPKQRAVLVLRLWNGMEYAEIAQALERTRPRSVRKCSTPWPGCGATWNLACGELGRTAMINPDNHVLEYVDAYVHDALLSPRDAGAGGRTLRGLPHLPCCPGGGPAAAGDRAVVAADRGP